MGQGYSAALPPGPSALEAADLSDLTFEKALGGARFLRTVRARHSQGVVVVKVCLKSGSSVSFKNYGRLLRQERLALRDVPNVLHYQRIRETATVGLLVRQFIHTSLYDRISIRPFLEIVEKKWIAFQLLCAVRDCHARGIFHGDIKTENILVTSWGWVYLTDFAATFKPVYLPEDNPADFSYFYDTSARRTCYLAPERFLSSDQTPDEGGIVQWNMDIFSLGCVLAELFTETPTFTLSQLFKYRKGEYDPTVGLLNKIDDEHGRALIGSMIRLDPGERWHAQDYLDEYRSKAFPLYFYQHLHTVMQEVTDPTSGRKAINTGEQNNGLADDRINRIYNDYELLAVSLGYRPVQEAVPWSVARRGLFPLEIDLPNNRHTADGALADVASDNGTLILLNVITSSIRSAGRARSKIRACELFLAFAERLPDEAKLDRILPYITPLLDDSNELVLVAALRSMTQLLSLVTVSSPINSSLFTQYIFPRLQQFVNTTGFKSKPIVRATYAACLASLAETASRFLDMTQALKADGSLPAFDKGAETEPDGVAAYTDAFDMTRLELLDAFEGQTKVFLTDSDTSVRRAFLGSVPSLCVFFGEARASDVILSHLNTYLNDPDWLLKCAFFRTIVGVATYIGGASLEDFILPLMLQALADPQEFVVEQALRSLASMAEIGLLQRAKTWELIDTVARFQMHPNIWVKEAASHFVAAATTYLSVADVRILVTPLIQPYLKISVATLSESELLDSLKKPLPRPVLDLALEWAKRTDRGAFWKSARESKQLSYRAVNQMPPTSSIAELGGRSLSRVLKNSEDDQWLGRLRNAGMQPEDELKVFAFREYVWRTAQRVKRDDEPITSSRYDDILPLAKMHITPHTVIFDSDAAFDQQRLQEESDRTIAQALQEAAGPDAKMPFKRLSIDGIPDTPRAATASPVTGPASMLAPDRTPSGLKKQPSGSLSSSPSSGIGLLAKNGDRALQHRGSAGGLMIGNEKHNKALAAVSTDDTNAAGHLNTPTAGSRRASPTGYPKRATSADHSTSSKALHNYAGSDPTVLKLLDTVYTDNFSVDAAEFGPYVQTTRRGLVQSNSSHTTRGGWRPRGHMLAILAEHSRKVTRIIVSPDNLFFLTGSDDGTVKVWDAARLERNVTHRSRQTYTLAAGIKVTSLCFIEATHTFVCTGSDGSVHVVKIDVLESANATRYGKPRTVREWQIPSNGPTTEHAVWTEHFRGDNASTLVIATNSSRILALDLKYITLVFDLQNPVQHGAPTCFCLGRRQDWLLVGTSQGVLDLWDLRFRLRLRSWAFRSAAPISRLQLHPTKKGSRRNKVCISGGTARGEVTVWDLEKLICHEVYRPACLSAPDSTDRTQLRKYELLNLDDERSTGVLDRLNIKEGGSASDSIAPSATASMAFGTHSTTDGSDSQHAFVVTGGPDGKVRFWDCDRLDGCRVVNGGSADEKPTYAFSQLGLDTRVLSEKMPKSVVEPDVDDPKATTTASPSPEKKPTGVTNHPPTTSSPEKKKLPGGTSVPPAPPKPSRYEIIRLSAQHLLSGHVDTITDVAVLEWPFGMILSADRSGQVFVYQ